MNRWFVAVVAFCAAVLLGILCLPLMFLASLKDSDDQTTGCAGSITIGNVNVVGSSKTTGDLAKGWEKNAAVIISVSNGRGFGGQGAVVALATAMQESKLFNNPGGDRDSVGLFQQRPSQGWGSVAQIMDPTYATNKFLDALSGVPNWQSMPVTEAAQRVQRSGFPLAYGPWESVARAILAGSGSGAVTPIGQEAANAACNGAGNAPVSGDVAGVITAMEAYLGLPYAWGGGSLQGPSRGFAQGAGTVGFDCSSYVRYGYFKATGITLPRTTRAQYAAASIRITDKSQLQAGDLVFFASNPRVPATIHHVALMTSPTRFLHEPSTGDVAKYVDNVWTSNYWTTQFIGAIRPLADPALNGGAR